MSQSADRQLTIDQAAAELGISRRTVERRCARGVLRSLHDGGRLLVLLPTPTDTLTAKLEQLTATVEQLTDRLTAVEAERDQAKALLEAVTSERDYLRQAHAASLTLSTRLLPERTETRPSWWRVWRR